MRPKIIALLLFTVVQLPCFSQEVSFGVGYQYLYAPQWDKAIATYNFSRPFRENNQPLLVNGTYFEGQAIFDSKKVLQGGLSVNHSYFRSAVKSTGHELSLNLHLLNLGYIIHIEASPKLAIELTISAIMNRLSSQLNGEPLYLDDRKYIAAGIGGNLALTANYKIVTADKRALSLFAGLGCSPFLWSPLAESILNQTSNLTGKDYTLVITGKAGIKLHVYRTKKTSADG